MTDATSKIWVHGIIAAFIGGGAAAVSASFSTALIDPDKFNMANGLGNMAKLAALTFMVSGILSVMGYLKQSPVPSNWTVTTATKTTIQAGEATKVEQQITTVKTTTPEEPKP